MATARKTLVLAGALSALAVGVVRADVAEMSSCGVAGRLATIASGGTTVQGQSPAEMARTYVEHCDFAALGRFTAVTVEDYHESTQVAVQALFVVDEVLLGAPRVAVKVKVSEGMLVAPGEDVSRNTAANIHEAYDIGRLDRYEKLVADLRTLHEMETPLTEPRFVELLGSVERLVWGSPGRVTRADELKHAHSRLSTSSPSTFYLEGGAIRPQTQFLLGLDEGEHAGRDRLTPIYALIHWGEYAVAVTAAIRAAVED